MTATWALLVTNRRMCHILYLCVMAELSVIVWHPFVTMPQELSVPMSKWLKAFPAMTSLHPFEAALLDLTVGAATYASVLGKVDMLRKALQEVSSVAKP